MVNSAHSTNCNMYEFDEKDEYTDILIGNSGQTLICSSDVNGLGV